MLIHFLAFSLTFAIIQACITSDGIAMKPGDRWVEHNRFVVACEMSDPDHWRMAVKACILPDGSHLELNQSARHRTYIYTCKSGPNGEVELVPKPNIYRQKPYTSRSDEDYNF